eukprot:1295678-Pyramimonas_sp.AAC.1
MLEGRSIHLCRNMTCRDRPGEILCKEYAALDPEAIVDICSHAKFTSCRGIFLLWRAFTDLGRGTWRIIVFTYCILSCGCSFCCRRRRRRKTGAAEPGLAGSVAE